MPIRYINPLPNPVQRGINVDFFDRKALERQSRHDQARALFTEDTKNIAQQKFLDPTARDQFLQERDQMFEDVVSANAGNLSRGFHDVLGAVEKSALHPYHNLSKRLVTESAKRSKLQEQFGSEFIDQSVGLDKPLYDPIEKVWRNPSSIQGGGVEANKYGKNVESLLSDISARKFGSNSPLYSVGNMTLASKYVSGQQLTAEELAAFASDPNVQQAFRANSPTSGIDTREVPNMGGITYQQMFADDNLTAQFIYGNISDKRRDDRVTKTSFRTDQAALERQRTSNRKKEVRYEQNLKNYYVRPIVSIGSVGKETITQENTNDLNRSIEETKQTVQNINLDLIDKREKFTDLLGPGQTMNAYTSKDGTFNRKLATDYIDINSTKRDEQGNVISELSPKEIEVKVDELDATFRKTQDLSREKLVFNKQITIGEQRQSDLNNVLIEAYYKKLSGNKGDNQKLKDAGINSSQELLALAEKVNDEGSIKLFGKIIPFGIANIFNKEVWEQKGLDYDEWKKQAGAEGVAIDFLNYRDDQLDEGFDMDILEKGRFGDENSIESEFNNHYKNFAGEVGVINLIGQLANKDGLNYLANDADLQTFINDYSFTNKDMSFIVPETMSGKGLTSHIIIKGEDKNGNKKEHTIVNAELNNDNGVANEFADRIIQQGQTHALNTSYDVRDRAGRFHYKGMVNYGDQALSVIGGLQDSPSGTEREMDVVLADGSPTKVFYTKLDEGYVVNVGGSKQNKRIVGSANEAFDISMTDLGRILWFHNNPKAKTNAKFYTPGTAYGKGVSTNISNTKIRPNTVPVQ